MKNVLYHKRLYIVVISMLLFGLTVSLSNVGAVDKIEQASQDDIVKLTSMLDLMKKYINITEDFYEIANDQRRAASFAVMEIKSIYEDKGDLEGAVKDLETVLQNTNDKTVRNIIRFQLFDLEKNLGRQVNALQHAKSILKENL